MTPAAAIQAALTDQRRTDLIELAAHPTNQRRQLAAAEATIRRLYDRIVDLEHQAGLTGDGLTERIRLAHRAEQAEHQLALARAELARRDHPTNTPKEHP